MHLSLLRGAYELSKVVTLGEIEKEDDLRTGEELKLFKSVAARFNFLAMDRPDILY